MGTNAVRYDVVAIGGGNAGLTAAARTAAAGAAETINLFAMAIRFGIDAAALAKMVFTYPTASSALPSMLG